MFGVAVLARGACLQALLAEGSRLRVEHKAIGTSMAASYLDEGGCADLAQAIIELVDDVEEVEKLLRKLPCHPPKAQAGVLVRAELGVAVGDTLIPITQPPLKRGCCAASELGVAVLLLKRLILGWGILLTNAEGYHHFGEGCGHQVWEGICVGLDQGSVGHDGVENSGALGLILIEEVRESHGTAHGMAGQELGCLGPNLLHSKVNELFEIRHKVLRRLHVILEVVSQEAVGGALAAVL
mmetsp:Transcript_60333/g.113899  ORF Transcript_60333/g.113899 Transcript_60333/m.113899 type:complete len:240 (-) Transcript_60333:643-1362(-)